MKRIVAWACLTLLLAGCSSQPSQNQVVLPPNKQTAPSTAAATTTTMVTSAPKTDAFEKVMVVDNEDCAIYITAIREDPVWGWVLDAQLENKTGDDTLMFSIDSASINGVEIDPLFASQVAPGKKAKEEISLSDAALADRDIGLYSDIELHFRVYDAEDWQEEDVATPSIHIYPYGAQEAVNYIRQPHSGDQVLVDNEEVTVIVTGFTQDAIWGYTAELFLVNKTDRRIMFTAENASVNGFMADPLYADSVGPGNCAFSRISWSDSALAALEITQVEQLEFTLRAYDEADWTAKDLLKLPVTLFPEQTQ